MDILRRIGKRLRSLRKKISRHLFWRHLLPFFYGVPYLHGPESRLIVGKQVGLANTLLNTRSGEIRIGDHVTFGHNVMVLTGYHDVQDRALEGRRPTLTDIKRDVMIEEGAWIASGAIIIGPVRIGKNAVVGAGSVVVKDIPSDVFAAGNPARPIKQIQYHDMEDA